MSGRGSRRRAARLLCAAACAALGTVPALAQTAPATTAPPASPPPDAAELDPSAPLDPMPDLGVDWPDLNAGEAPPGATPTPNAPTQAAAQPQGDRRYAVQVEGLATVGNGEELLKAFRQQSALEANRKKPANAAQIERRSRADADLLEELLRSQGYYDADVEPSTSASGDMLLVILTAEPGPQYRFAAVSLPGLEAAGPEADRLRKTFNVVAGDPVIAGDVIAAGLALRTALGEQGYAEAKIGEQDVEINHQTRLATLTLPVTPGPIARFGTIRVSGEPPFSAHHVGIIARFKPGETYKRSKVDDLRRGLIATGLVAAADIQTVPVNGGRTVDLAVKLEPAPSHTIAGELGYGTGQGARSKRAGPIATSSTPKARSRCAGSSAPTSSSPEFSSTAATFCSVTRR